MRIALLLVLALAACHREDDCDRALARLARIDASKHRKAPGPRVRRWMREGCEQSGRWDPAIGCALRGPTDEAASACIDAFLRDVVGSDGSGAPHPTDGKGLNPLLDE